MKRRIPPLVWWIASFVMVGLAIIWLPGQCVPSSLDSTSGPGDDPEEELVEVDQDKELEFREDGMWYEVGSQTPFEGMAVSFHEDGTTMKTRTRIKEGKAFGLIEEWDANGSVVGARFKGEFAK